MHPDTFSAQPPRHRFTALPLARIPSNQAWLRGLVNVNG
jgi:hypothetical protein